jgi:photosystem II stability/assembly factor-like uncharacterized protein
MSLEITRVTRSLSFAALVLMNMGCEAPLNLTGIEQEKSLVTHRFDQFQASASIENVVVVVGTNGVILSSKDNGDIWQRKQLSEKSTLIDIVSCANGQFAALSAERQLWISKDSAESWQAHKIETRESVTSIACAADNTLWVGGSFSTLLSSTDPSTGWNEFSLGEDATITEIQFVDDNNAYVLGEFGLVLYSENNGTNWQQLNSLPHELYPQAALFVNTEIGFIVGLNGKILSTHDGAQTWQTETTETENPLFGLGNLNGDLYATGENGVLLQRQDSLWKVIPHNKKAHSYLRAIHPLNNNQLLLAGGGTMFKFSPKHIEISLVEK